MIKKKKILIFGYTLEIGGAERVLTDTICYLNDKCEIDLFLLRKKGDLIKELPGDVNVHQINKTLFGYLLFRFIPFYRKVLINYFANKKTYDSVFAYMEGRCATWVSDIKKKILKIGWIHADVAKSDMGISNNEAKKSYHNLDRIICVSKEAKNSFCKRYNVSPKKVSVIYNYINENEIIKKSKAFKVDNKIFTFVNVANFREEKRHDRLLSAAKVLKKEGYNFQIQLIGDGPKKKEISYLIKKYDLLDRVNLIGICKNPYPYIKQADFLILVSDSEAYGIVLKEALILKTKILSTSCIGPIEITKNGEYAILVNNNGKAVVNEMRNILRNPDKYKYLEKKLSDYKSDNEKIKKETLSLIGL